jgi:hypothetical protein
MTDSASEKPREVAIPSHVFVRCPLSVWKLRQAKRCEGCEHFCGLSQRLSRDGMPFEAEFQVRCAFPVDRELYHVEIENGSNH